MRSAAVSTVSKPRMEDLASVLHRIPFLTQPRLKPAVSEEQDGGADHRATPASYAN